jgi:Ring finger domain
MSKVKCPICYNEITRPLYETGRRLVCGHWFHSACINKWFKQLNACVCPYCRQAPNVQEGFKFSVRHLILHWSSKFDKPFDGLNFELIFAWSAKNKGNLGLQYRELIELGSDTFVAVAKEQFPFLVAEGYFVQGPSGFTPSR